MRGHDDIGTATGTRNGARLAVWTLVWLVTLAIARFGPDMLWHGQPAASWIAVIVNVVMGVGLILAYARYLRGVDELQQKILLDATAVALGVGLVGGFACAAANSAELIHLNVNLALALLLSGMGVTYALAAVAGTLRYR